MVDALVTQTGYAGETVTLDVEDEGRIVGSQEVKLPIDGEPAAVRVRFTASDAGPRVFRFRIAPRAGELVTQNNQREALDRRLRPHREDPVLRGRAAARDEVPAPRRRRRQEPAGRHAAADRRQQVLPAACSTRRTQLAGGFPEDARRAVRLPRPDSRQHRGGRVHRRSAADDRPSSSSAAAAACSCSAARARSPRAATPARRWPMRCRSCSSAWRARLDDLAGVAAEGAADARRRRRTRSRRSRRPRRHRSTAGTSCRRSSASTRIKARQAGRDGAPDRHRREARARSPCSRSSATAAARRWRSPCRTPGAGRCTRAFRSRT